MSCLEKISPQEIKRAKVLVVRRFRLEMIPSQDLSPLQKLSAGSQGTLGTRKRGLWHERKTPLLGENPKSGANFSYSLTTILQRGRRPWRGLA